MQMRWQGLSTEALGNEGRRMQPSNSNFTTFAPSSPLQPITRGGPSSASDGSNHPSSNMQWIQHPQREYLEACGTECDFEAAAFVFLSVAAPERLVGDSPLRGSAQVLKFLHTTLATPCIKAFP
ncbi:uncharacterized protein BDZ99DRAFT_521068 [Mytilinidion resinicola]|uniref:Uncharacterized protein n=1 Tax=Mytilinidion resinicola TaxID=574789 RepID=A0A6A6YP41_9PEZI|nr:uncharacterized protein BDZ99DRAFT_521068 [Mytilinidion resinicola]KAF2809745.1 hypothetical protein BDZ99DRAFT_521068 [Mytilinidion resinicola]